MHRSTWLLARCAPAIGEFLIVGRTNAREGGGVDPSLMNAFAPEVRLRRKSRRIIERGNGEVHLLGASLVSEAERCAAFGAIRPLGDRAALKPVGLMAPADGGLLDPDHRQADIATGALTHTAVAKIGGAERAVNTVTESAALTAASKLVNIWFF